MDHVVIAIQNLRAQIIAIRTAADAALASLESLYPTQSEQPEAEADTTTRRTFGSS